MNSNNDDIRDTIIKGYFRAEYTYSEIVELLKKFHNINIGLRQFKRIIAKLGLKRKKVTENINNICLAVIEELNGSGSCLGYKPLWRRLMQVYNLQARRQTVLEILRIIDPEGLAARLQHRLKRRVYNVKGPNFIWHIDGNDKLKPFGFSIHGAVDGYSRKVLWLNVATTNKDPRVVAYYHLKTLEKFGLMPTLIRTDCGTENVNIEIIHRSMRFDADDDLAKNCYLKGKSTANQRVESFWGQMRRQMIQFYMDLFKDMRDSNVFDSSNGLHQYCLQYCFGPLIQVQLDEFRREWNRHRIRKQRGNFLVPGKPNIMFYLPEKYGATDCKKPINQLEVDVCYEELTTVPMIYEPLFDELVNAAVPNLKHPSNAQEALELYDQILTSLNTFGVDDF